MGLSEAAGRFIAAEKKEGRSAKAQETTGVKEILGSTVLAMRPQNFCFHVAMATRYQADGATQERKTLPRPFQNF